MLERYGPYDKRTIDALAVGTRSLIWERHSDSLWAIAFPKAAEGFANARLNKPPELLAASPRPGSVTIFVGEASTFEFVVHDPEDDQIHAEWYVDGVLRDSRWAFTVMPDEQDIGVHTVNLVSRSLLK